VELRNRAEHAIRRFHALEVANDAAAVIDYDCAPTEETIEPYSSRLAALDDLKTLRREAGDSPAGGQLEAHATYLAATLGEQIPLADYLHRTQGCAAPGWSEDYLQHRLSVARNALDAVGIGWSEKTRKELRSLDQPLQADKVRETIDDFTTKYEPAMRDLTGTTAHFDLTVDSVRLNAYWAYWLDGAGYKPRMRINLTNATFGRRDAYRFALHEVLGHALQYASLTAQAETNDVDWLRLLAIHSNHQVLCEGLAQVLPLVAEPDDPSLIAVTRLDHYVQLVRAELHLLINSGATVTECRDRALERVPYLDAKDTERELRDRSRDPQLRTYLWAYPAGIDWFMNLSEQRATLLPEVLRAAYKRPLSPSELHQLWPGGPTIGGDA
jgi:hypothetical protein